MKSFSIVFFVLFCKFLYAQIDYFSETDTDLTRHYARLYELEEKAKKNTSITLKKSDENLLKESYEESALYTKALNRSGYIIFSSPGVKYLNEIKSNLLKSMPELNRFIQIYIAEDASINAFAAMDGSIYVNTGLLAKVENEAQLAFILCHEIVHILRAHLASETLNLAKAADVYNSSQAMNKKEFMKLKKHLISVKNETESDLEGFDLFVKSGYQATESAVALDLLKDADNFNPELDLDDKIYFMNHSDYEILFGAFKNLQDSLSKAATEKNDNSEADELSSHPELSVRIESMIKKIEELSSTENQSLYIISKENFLGLHEQASKRINQLFAKNFDFVKLFLNSAYNYHVLKDYTKENLGGIAYGLQGLINDQIKNESKRHTFGSVNPSQQLFQYYYSENPDAFLRNSFKTLDSLAKVHPEAGLENYLNSIYFMLMTNKESKTSKSFLENPVIDLSQFPEVPKAELNLSDVEFEIVPQADISARKLRKFNSHKKSSEIQKGKTALANFQNFRIYRKREGYFRNYQLSHKRMDRLDARTARAMTGLSKRFDNKVVTLVPNKQSYDGAQMNAYKLLNDWVAERAYFDDHNFTSFFKQEVDEYTSKTGIQNVMIGLLIEIKSFSAAKFMPAYFSPFAVPFFLPQIVANVSMAATRKFMLALTFDLESQKLVFYDKRCYLEPDSAALIEIMLTDILNRFHEK